MYPTAIREFFHWAKNHTGWALIFCLLSVLATGGYALVTGYASKFGETLASGEYKQFRKSVETYTVIDNILQHLLQDYKAHRAGVARFHDSVRDIGSNSIFYVTLETMVTSPGVSANLEELKNLSASMFSQILPDLLDHKMVYLKIGDVKNPALRELAERRGVHATLYVPVYDLSDRLIGFLTLTWINDYDLPKQTDLPEIEKKLDSIADRVGAYFSRR
jgi:hypothetical protein